MKITNTVSHFWIDTKLTFNVVVHYVLKTNRVYLAFGLFAVILFTLQWLFNIDQLLEIIFGSNPLSVVDRIDFMLDGFINIFRFADDFVPISMISIALLQSLSLTLLVSYRASKRAKSKQVLPLGMSLLGVGCVACGGSILTPILGLVASGVSVAFAENLSHLLLLIALMLSYKSLTSIAFTVASVNAGNRSTDKS